MARKREYVRLAKLKAQKKEIDEEIKKVQDRIFQHAPQKEFPTEYGILKYEEQRQVAVPDNSKLITASSITQKIFINKASLSASKIKAIVGENEFEELVRTGVLKENGPKRFYTLYPPKKNQEQL